MWSKALNNFLHKFDIIVDVLFLANVVSSDKYRTVPRSGTVKKARRVLNFTEFFVGREKDWATNVRVVHASLLPVICPSSLYCQ